MKTYHDHVSVATGKGFKGPGGSLGFVGSADNPSETPEPPPGGTTSPESPASNTGTLLSFPLTNRFLIDWFAATSKELDPCKVAEVIGLDPSFRVELDRGMHGYSKMHRYGDIIILHGGQKDMGCHIIMSGKGCRQYESQFEESPWLRLFALMGKHKIKCKRLDLAHDCVDGALDLALLNAAARKREIRTRFRSVSENSSFSLSRDASDATTGFTLYFGKRASRVFLRFYDKAAQLGAPLPWVRCEIELKDKRAQRAVDFLASGLPVGQLFTGIINEYLTVINLDNDNISRCSVQDWWASWLQSAEKIRLTVSKEVKTIDQVMEYVKKQYAPTLAMIKTHLGVISFHEYFKTLITDGMTRMSMRHEQILFKSAYTTADNYTPEQEAFDERVAIMIHDGGMEPDEAKQRARALREREEPS